MKKILIILLSVSTTLLVFAQNPNPKNDYQIDVTLKPFKNQWVYLAHYFTNQTKYLVDSVLLDNNSKAVFKGNNESMNGGVYLIIFPGKSSYVEFIIDQNKKMSITIDTAHIQDILFSNSPENIAFASYQKYLVNTQKKYAAIETKMLAAQKVDSQALRQNRINQYNDMVAYKKDYIQKNPTHFLSTLFLLMEGPAIPKLSNQTDSFQYFANHYWDNLSFSDPRILRTPILDQKLNNYIHNLIPNQVDSMTHKAYFIVEQSKKDSLTYRYYLSKLAIMYGNSQIPTQADAFYYLFTQYIENQQHSWLTPDLYAQMQRRANFIAGNILGNKAYDITLLDTAEKKFSLYNIDSKYVVLCFWDPICGHCLETVPMLDSLYQKNWKNKGVTMLGIYVDGGVQNWKKYIATHTKNWLHGYESDAMRNVFYAEQKPNFRQLYDIQETPIIYLLDKDKKILLKKVVPQYLNAYLESLEKESSSAEKKKK